MYTLIIDSDVKKEARMYSLQYNTRSKALEILKTLEAKASYYQVLDKGSYQAMQSKIHNQHHSSLVL